MKIVTKIVLVVTITVSLTIGGVGFVTSRQIQAVVHAQIERVLETNLEFAVQEITATRDRIHHTSHIVAKNRAVGKALDLLLSRGVNQILNELVAISSSINYVLIAEPNGDIFAASTRNSRKQKIAGERLLGRNIRENPLFLETSTGQTAIGRPGRDSFQAVIDSDTGLSQWFITPVGKRGKIIGWVVLSYAWERELYALLTKITRHLVDIGNPTIETVLTDSNGNIVVGDTTNNSNFRGDSGKLWMTREIMFGGEPMKLIIVNDRSKTNQPVVEAQAVMLTVYFLTGLLLIIVLSVLLRKTLLHRLRLLHEGAEALGSGSLSFRLPDLGKDEVGDLGAAFNAMTARLDAAAKTERELQRELREAQKLEAASQLANAETHIRAIVDNTMDGIITIGESGVVEGFNPVAEKLFGFSRDEAIGHKISMLMPESYSSQHDGYLSNYLSTGEAKIIGIGREVEGQRKDGTTFPMHLAVSEARIEGRRMFIGITRDLTAEKRAERRLKAHAAELERSNSELQSFAYVASHDLQEPLRKVQTFGDRLKRKFGERLGDEGRDYVERMQSAAERMSVLIRDLLSFSRVNSRAKTFEPVDLAEVARRVLSNLEVRIGETRARVEVGELPTIDADQGQMRQLLQNLIGNALKFHREEAPPVVSIHCEWTDEYNKKTSKSSPINGYCRLTVEDNGIGFDEEYVEKIFTIFQRLHGRNEYQGTGIGLAVCRKIVERHGGSISAKSAPGEGAVFTLTLPVKHAQEEYEQENNES